MWFKKKLKWLSDAWNIIKPFWTSSEKYFAFLVLTAIIAFCLLEVHMLVRLNKWNVVFFNTIQNYDKPGFMQALFQGFYIIALLVLVMITKYYFNSVLEIKWRKWMTSFYLTNWFANKTYYKARFTKNFSDNPDQRISEDIKGFVSLTQSLFMGLFNSIVSLGAFVAILWTLSGNFQFNFLNNQFYIPGFMVWMAVLYAFLGTYSTFKIGRPLIHLTYEQQMYEAEFRYNLVRIREYAEHVASYNGEAIEKKIITKDFDNIVNNFMQTVKRNLKINIFNFAYMQISNIVPTIISAGRYFAKEITLGDMMQVNSAFGQVQSSISYFIFAYSMIADWQAVKNRLLGFNQIGSLK